MDLLTILVRPHYNVHRALTRRLYPSVPPKANICRSTGGFRDPARGLEVAMRQSPSLRGIVLFAAPVVSLGALIAVAGSLATAKPPKKQPAFPLSLYAAAKPDDFSGDKECLRCHQTAAEMFYRSPHALFVNDPRQPLDRRGCEACHGPGKPHIDHRRASEGLYDYVISYLKDTPEQISAACLRCHADTMSQPHWHRTGHAQAGVTCTNCHQIHWLDRTGRDRIRHTAPDQKIDDLTNTIGKITKAPLYPDAPEPKALIKSDEPTLCGQCHRRELAEFRHNFHHPVPEGRLQCSDCHIIHPNRDGRKRMRTAKQFCITCHSDVAGPFVYEHDPVSDLTDQGCMECHRPHGSPNPRMLSSFSRGLCGQCHTDKLVNHNPGRTCWDAGCHSSPHGSNHSQFFLQR